tara:strand:+ start:1846 stop:2985 length:1140 start_codon:yes stop_codon:yes gene_type:complete
MSIVNLQVEPIYCRSPYIIEVNNTFPVNTGSKIELFLWNEGSTPPTSPTYVLSKLIPAPDKLQMLYNISNYIKEYISFIGNDPAVNVIPKDSTYNEWCYVKVKRYYEAPANSYNLLDEKTYYAFDGYGYYEQGYNPELSIYGLAPNTTDNYYDYFADPNNIASGVQPFNNKSGDIRIIGTNGYIIRYTNLVSGSVNEFTLGGLGITISYVVKIYAVFVGAWSQGNKIEYVDDLGTTLATWIFRPKEECKYTPIACDFINKYGAWQRTFFYKASSTSLGTTKKEYDLYSRDLVNYDPRVEQKKVFNLNGTETIKVNTDWVEEAYNELVLKPLMLSEVIRLDNKPVVLKTQKTELFEHINKKMINYSLEFEYANAVINNLV